MRFLFSRCADRVRALRLRARARSGIGPRARRVRRQVRERRAARAARPPGLRHDGGPPWQHRRDRRHDQAGQAAAPARPDAPSARPTGGFTPRQRAGRAQRPNGSWDVYRPYFDPAFVGHRQPGRDRRHAPDALPGAAGARASANQDHVKRVVIGTDRSTNKPILALKVTKDAREVPDGQRPAVLYSPRSTRVSGSPPRPTAGWRTCTSTTTAAPAPAESTRTATRSPA